MNRWQLIDVGRTMIGAVPGMYEYVQNNAHMYFPKKRADVLADLAGKRETNPELISQDVFSDFCKIWVAGYQNGQWKIDARDFIFPDTVPFVAEQKGKSKKIGVLTSGSQAFTDVLLGVKFDKPMVIGGTTYSGLPQMVDQYFLGEEWGDKQKPESFRKIFNYIGKDLRDGLEAVFDDKAEVIIAAFEAFGFEDWPMDRSPILQRKARQEGLHFYQEPILSLVWMNRKGKQDERIAALMNNFRQRAAQASIFSDYRGLQLESAVLNVKSFAEYMAHEKHSTLPPGCIEYDM